MSREKPKGDLQGVYANQEFTREMLTEDKAFEIATAIITQTIFEYKQALKKIKRLIVKEKLSLHQRGALGEALKSKFEIEYFFSTEWFQILTLRKIHKEPSKIIEEYREYCNFDEVYYKELIKKFYELNEEE